MDRYQKVEQPRSESAAISENEIRITSQGLIRNYVNYASSLLQERSLKVIVLKAMGQAISKAVAATEIIKKWNLHLHQDVSISSVSITDVWEPIEEGLVPLETKRLVSVISITLSIVEPKKKTPGYQAPAQVEQPKRQQKSQQLQQPQQQQQQQHRQTLGQLNQDSYGRERSRGSGRGRGWARGGYGGYNNNQGQGGYYGYRNNQGGYNGGGYNGFSYNQGGYGGYRNNQENGGWNANWSRGGGSGRGWNSRGAGPVYGGYGGGPGGGRNGNGGGRGYVRGRGRVGNRGRGGY
ncbi:uncharacterized protein LOC141846192 [Curcuma longa]|uniref:uncharacterized protein LOC141846192 n=1 Tax=Curcuma longa TaxID=136217 RepID=UPI003D9EB03D